MFRLWECTQLLSLTVFSDVSYLLQDTSLDSFSSELAGIKKAAHKCLGSCRAGAQEDRRAAVEELERKVLELNEHQQKVQEQMAHKHNGKNTYESINVLISFHS